MIFEVRYGWYRLPNFSGLFAKFVSFRSACDARRDSWTGVLSIKLPPNLPKGVLFPATKKTLPNYLVQTRWSVPDAEVAKLLTNDGLDDKFLLNIWTKEMIQHGISFFQQACIA